VPESVSADQQEAERKEQSCEIGIADRHTGAFEKRRATKFRRYRADAQVTPAVPVSAGEEKAA
jgi:hypothetical protein